jgi:hypothetical protein
MGDFTGFLLFLAVVACVVIPAIQWSRGGAARWDLSQRSPHASA